MKIDTVHNKSCQKMSELSDESIDMIMTSCPYWGLRDYGDDVKEIWGDSNCEHSWGDDILPKGNKSGPHGPGSTIGAKLGQDGARRGKGSNFCQKCGAWRGQLGLEPTLEMYIEHLLLITLECKRVLKSTGVMWWNHGDSYFTGKGSCHNPGGGDKSWKSWNERKGIYPTGRAAPNRMSKESPPKCLALQGYRLIIKMIDEQGWILRNTAIWNKPNGMPSSVKDRLANKYEPIFCLVKNTKPRYYWNEKTGLMTDKKPPKTKQKEEIDWDWQEVGIVNDSTFNVRVRDANTVRFLQGATEEEKANYGKSKLKKKSHWHSLGYWYDLDAIREPQTNQWIKRTERIVERPKPKGEKEGMKEKGEIFSKTYQASSSGKNPGDVWTIPTQPRPEAHFATFPDALCIKPILSTCPQEICKKCGKPRVRITRKGDLVRAGKGHVSYGYKGGSKHQQSEKSAVSSWSQNFVKDGLIPGMAYERETIGWTDCGCNAGWEPGIVLDPFAGRGTALIMAKKLGRHYVGYELKKEYCEKLIKPALEEIDPLFS